MTGATRTTGFYSAIDSTNSTNWNFYAAGSATSYFKGGIQFDIADGASALDHYEEGTWTPVLSQQDGAGTFTYAVQSGSYTRVGRVVTCQGKLTISAKDGTTASPLRLGGFPFTSLNNNERRNCGTVAIWGGFGGTRYPNAGIIMLWNATAADFQCGTDGSTTANVRGSDIDSPNMRVEFSITYTVA